MSTIRFIEELSLTALPCLQTVHYDGWILRFAEGHTRRANSVNLLYRSTLPLAEKVAYCEHLYAQNGLPAVFKFTPASQPLELDRFLAARGYWEDSHTSVQTLALSAVEAPTYAAITSLPHMTDRWLAAYGRLNHVAESRQDTLRRMLAGIVPECCFLTMQHGDEDIAVGLGVLEHGYVGLYDLVVAEPYRKQGIGQQLVLRLLEWAKQRGARHAYLQVMTANAPALRLYKKIGFREWYQYWYQMPPTVEPSNKR